MMQKRNLKDLPALVLGALYRFIMLMFDKNMFSALFNLRSYVIASPARLTWDGSTFVFTDRSIPSVKYYIRHQRQCNMAYQYGALKRAESLASSYFLQHIDFRDGDIVLDCGANVGDLKLWFMLEQKFIDYIGFEPSPVEFSCLMKNVSPSVVHNVGLYNNEGEIEFYVSSQGADSSLIAPRSFDKTIIVRTAKLKSFIKAPVRLLKLEAEGAEPEILEGLEEKLGSIEFIAADLGYERGVACESTLVPVTNYLLQRGFELMDVSHDRICALYRNVSFGR